ncbi:MAG TPA: hypothetical protein VFN57_09890, partial [Thermomicrobiaceae bacterium]|nr:hypothetical protein [Thermomicrobiaceae bacterium]
MASQIEALRRLTEVARPLEPGQSVVIHAGTVLTGRRAGERVLRDQAVTIEDGRIATVTPWRGDAVPAGTEVIDAARQTVMPGLIETHLHVTGEWPHDPHGTHLEPFPESRVLRGLLDTWAVFT